MESKQTVRIRMLKRLPGSARVTCAGGSCSLCTGKTCMSHHFRHLHGDGTVVGSGNSGAQSSLVFVRS